MGYSLFQHPDLWHIDLKTVTRRDHVQRTGVYATSKGRVCTLRKDGRVRFKRTDVYGKKGRVKRNHAERKHTARERSTIVQEDRKESKDQAEREHMGLTCIQTKVVTSPLRLNLSNEVRTSHRSPMEHYCAICKSPFLLGGDIIDTETVETTCGEHRLD